jgi:hypothetical protein
MKSPALTSVTVLLALACGCKSPPPQASAPARAPAPAAPAGAMTAGAADPGPKARGKVLEVLNTAGYTYVRVQSEGAPERWAATTEFEVAPGDEVVFSTSMPMSDYESKTLARKFDVVYFADRIDIVRPDISSLLRPGMPAAPMDMPAAPMQARGSTASSVPPGVVLDGIEKAPGGLTVAEILEKGNALSGKDVAVRGRVVKFTGGVLGKNWLHLRDGSGAGGAADVTVTTEADAAIGDLVLARGRVATKQDFGSGYSYDVLIQDATLER